MFARLRNRLRLGSRAATEIGGLPADGRVKVVGKAVPGKQLLTAPITGRSCVFYRVDIGEWFNGTKTPLLSEQSDSTFFVTDATGRALVDPENAEILLRRYRETGHSSTFLEEHRALLARHGYTMLDDYGELRSLAFEEYLIPPDAMICVLGRAGRRADPTGSAGYRQQPQQCAIQADSEGFVLLAEA